MENVVSFQDIWLFALRNRGRIIKATIATAVAAMIITYLTPPTYEATSKILVKFGREHMYRPEVGEREVVPVLSRDKDTFLNTELQILRSEDLALSVVTAVGVNNIYPSVSNEAVPTDARILGLARDRFVADLGTWRMPDSDVIRVVLHNSNAEMTARALNQLVELFRAKHLLAYSDPKATAFLEEKVAKYRDELAKVEETLKALQLDSKSFSIDDQRAGLFQQRRGLDVSLKETRNHIAGLEEKLMYLRSEKQKASMNPERQASEQNRAIVEARRQLLDLELQEQKLLATFSDTSRQVTGVRKQIELVKDFLEKQKAAIGHGEFVEDLEKQIVAAVAELRFQEAKRDNQAGQAAQLEKEMGRIPAQDAEYRNLVREREAAEKTYQTYVKKLEEAHLSEDMDREKIANISVIEAASVPLVPISPSKRLNLLVGLFMGFVLGVGWGFVAEWRAATRGGRAPEETERKAPGSMTQAEVGVASFATQALGRYREDDARDRLGEARDETGVVGPKTAAAVAARDRHREALEETVVVGPKTAEAMASDDRPEEAPEESERVLSLEPGDAQTPQVDDSQADVNFVRRDMDPKWEPAGTAVLNWRPAPASPEAEAPDGGLEPASGNATAGGLALAAWWKGQSLLKWKARSLLTLARKATTGDDRGSAIVLDQADLGPAPATQALDRDHDAVSGEETAKQGSAEVREESDWAISLEPGDGVIPRVAPNGVIDVTPRGPNGVIETRLVPRDRESRRKRKRRAKNKGDGEPVATVATVVLSSEPESASPEAATAATAPDDGSVTTASSSAPVERLALAANPIAWVVAFAVLTVGGWLLVVLFEGTPPWKAMRQAPPPTTVQPAPSSKLGNEGAHSLAKTPRPLDRQESVEASMPRARQLEEERTAPKTARKAAENARTQPEAQSRQVVDPAALARAQEDERTARADQERTEQEEQEEMQRLQERKMAEEARRLADERKRTQEARVAEEVARAAAVTPAATLPPRTAPPEPTVERGQLVSVSDQGVIPPTVKRAVQQVYPPQALRKKVEGTVELNVLVDETGKVVDAQVVTAAGGNVGLNEAAVALAKKSMFHAPTKNGVPVKAWIPMTIDYRLPR